MIEDLLPPSPNWYCSQACDCSYDGLFAYATRNSIFLLDVRNNSPSYAGCLTGHSERVTAVKFGRETHDRHLCATAGDDGCVKVWDTRNKAVLNDHRYHNENKVTAVQWCASTVPNSQVISGDEKGTLVWWNHASGGGKEFTPEKRHIYCLASCPHNGEFVAIGYKTGLVLIVDISGKGQILQRLRGHDEEVHSVCWSPGLGEDIPLRKPKQDGDKAECQVVPTGSPPDDFPMATASALPSTLRERGCLLVSGSRDRTLKVWNTTQGKAVLTLALPPRGGVQRTRDRSDDGGKAKVWVGLCWPSDKPREFLSSSYGGDLILWDLCKPGKQKWEYIGMDNHNTASHNRIIFNISSIPHCPDMFITTSMDRQIICWNRKTLKMVWLIPTLGGFVYTLSACSVDPGCLALGVGDNMIRVWNSSSPGRGKTISILWQGIKSKVTALSWHPERDNCLAYGTDDGRVGIYSTFTQGKGPALSSTFHKKTVYSLSWGPHCLAKEGVSGYCLYSCGGDGMIYQHDPTKLGEDATNFNSLIRSANQISYMLPLRTDVSWRDDGRAVAIGNEDGSIEIVACPSLLLLCTIRVHHKLINCLEWYPTHSQSEASVQVPSQSAGILEDGSSGTGQSGKRWWLASGSNEPQVQVHDLTSVLGGIEPVQLKTPVTGSFRTLNGHTLRITALSWSPHGDGRLVSASYDGTAQVWDTLKGEPIANFRGHLGRLFSVSWSILDPDVIFSGGEDFCLLKWRVSQVQHTRPPAHKRNTAAFMQRSGKSKSASSGKSKKKAKSAKDTCSVGSSSPGSCTPEPTSTKDAPPIPEGLPPDGSLLDPPVDMSDLQRLLEEKRLEMQKLTLTEASEAEARRQQTENVMSSEPTFVEEKEVTELKTGEVDEAGEKGRGGDTEVGVESVAQTTEGSDVTYKKDGRRKKKHKSLFPLSRSQDNRGKLYHLEDCVTLAHHKYDDAGRPFTTAHPAVGEQVHSTDPSEAVSSARLHPGVGDAVHLGLFADRRAAFAMFREEGIYHSEAGNRDQRQCLDMWKGNLAGTLAHARECNQLNSFLVAMAPLGGYDVWLETVEAYAQQLERCEDYSQAATYYLACHKIHKAIAVLLDNKLFREAVALASVRLSPFDPAFTEVYRAWASHLDAEGSYGQAAKCYLTINQPTDAVMLLARKSDILSLSAALRVACITHLGDLTIGLMVRYLHECLMAGDWLEAQTVLANHKSVLAGSLIAALHEVIVTTLTHQKLILRDLFEEPKTNPWIQGMFRDETNNMDDLSGWTVPLFEGATPLPAAVQHWFLQCHMDQTDEDLVQRLYDEVVSIRQQNTQHLPTKQLLIELAFELTLGQLSLLMAGESETVPHWLQAVVMCHDAGDVDMARGVLSLVLPEGIYSIMKLHKSAAVTSLYAYYLFTVLYSLWWEVGCETTPSKNPELLVSKAGVPRDTQRGIETNSDTANIIARRTEATESHLEGTSGTVSRVMATERASELVENPGQPIADFTGSVSETQAQITFDQHDLFTTLTDCTNQSVESYAASASIVTAPSCSNMSKDVNQGHDATRSQFEERLVPKLETISKALLSEPHAKVRSLKGSIRCIQKAVEKLVTQHATKGQEPVPVDHDQEGSIDKDRAPDRPDHEAVDCGFYASRENESAVPTVKDGGAFELKERATSPDVCALSQIVSESTGRLVNSCLPESLNPLEVSTNIVSSRQDDGTPVEVDIATEKQFDSNSNAAAKETHSEVDKYLEVCLPSSWEAVMADVKYIDPALTYTDLLQEQSRLMQELEQLGKRCPFPDSVESAMVLVHVCRAARLKRNLSKADQQELKTLEKEAITWGLEHSWLTFQRKLFIKHLANLVLEQPNSAL
ncbi:gem-associated protein 5-like isoform X2 [Acanthaster planci]|uniref:Gem-associated protein 5-like isoform X2 n=1 Tax=Acanthaster planci TaxID=133434 RepID=A0A8B7XVF5_ACAPL|nr:gem-associated protein 5-like isoform X2 [Acanthaster planci]